MFSAQISTKVFCKKFWRRPIHPPLVCYKCRVMKKNITREIWMRGNVKELYPLKKNEFFPLSLLLFVIILLPFSSLLFFPVRIFTLLHKEDYFLVINWFYLFNKFYYNFICYDLLEKKVNWEIEEEKNNSSRCLPLSLSLLGLRG